MRQKATFLGLKVRFAFSQVQSLCPDPVFRQDPFLSGPLTFWKISWLFRLNRATSSKLWLSFSSDHLGLITILEQGFTSETIVQKCSVKKGVLRNFANCNFIKKETFAKFLRTTVRLLLQCSSCRRAVHNLI